MSKACDGSLREKRLGRFATSEKERLEKNSNDIPQWKIDIKDHRRCDWYMTLFIRIYRPFLGIPMER